MSVPGGDILAHGAQVDQEERVARGEGIGDAAYHAIYSRRGMVT